MENQTQLCICFILVVFLADVIFSLTIDDCKQEWVPGSGDSYTFRVDCSNLGFRMVPDNLSTLTSELLLNDNRISHVDDQAFAGLTSLHTLDLSGNDIVSLNQTHFEKNAALKKLDLSRNKLYCDWRLWWLVGFSKKLETFAGNCFSPRPLRGRLVSSLTVEDLSVDCLSVKQLSNVITDGEYRIRVFGRDNSYTQVSIYCSDMGNEVPKEYLTLLSGQANNYVNVSHAETKCKLDEDSALQEKLKNSNREIYSMYKKVRLDVRGLKLLTTDNTFATDANTAFGRPFLCGDVICLGGIATIDLRGTKFHLKSSKQIQQTFSSSDDNCDLRSESTELDLELIDSKKRPFPACTLPLGMQSQRIPDNAITASSFMGRDYHPYYARLNSMKVSGWCAETADENQYLVIDLGDEFVLSGISTQGHKSREEWVTKFSVLYSSDGGIYDTYKALGQNEIINANKDSNTVQTHWFEPRFYARYVKIKPLTWNKGFATVGNICMRVELYGCQSDVTSYIIKQNPERLCLTVDTNKKGLESYPLRRHEKCSGQAFMFTYHRRKLQHTKTGRYHIETSPLICSANQWTGFHMITASVITGLCLDIGERDAFILTKNCHSTKIMFQKVRHETTEAFLIKDLNGYCARLYENADDNNLYSAWKYCQNGGFTVLQMTRKGTETFAPSFARSNKYITADLFQKVKLECRPLADPYVVYKWTKTNPYQIGSKSIKTNVIKKSEYSTLTFPNITWGERGRYYCNVWNSQGDAKVAYDIKVNPIQRFTMKPVDQRIIFGESIFFACTSYGIPEPIVSWIFFDQQGSLVANIAASSMKYVLHESGTLVVKNASYADQGKYTCVSKSPGLEKNVSANLQVYVTQNFTTVPSDKYVLFGSATLFDCVSHGAPKPVIEWRIKLNKLDRNFTVDRSYKHQYEVLQNGSLLVKSAMIDDEGEYFCVSKSPGLIRDASADLTVFVTQNFTVKPDSQMILYHYDVIFNCTSDGIPKPRIHWMFQNKAGVTRNVENTGGKYKVSNGRLTITMVDYSDEGEYVCVSISPRLKTNVSAKLDVYVTQSFDVVPLDKDVLYGSNHSLKCLSTGIPQPFTEWKFKPKNENKLLNISELLSQNVFFDKQEKEVLHIVNARLQDSGEYICVSYSPGLIVNVSAAINVYVTQNFTVKPVSQTLLRGDTALFNCRSEGHPPPKVSWKLVRPVGRGEIIEKSIFTKYSNNSLVLQNVQNKDEGQYVCISESPGLKVNVTASLLVHIKPQISLKSNLGKMTAGQSTEIKCDAAGDPTPVVQWYKRINGVDEKVRKTDATLELFKVKKEQQGVYICEAKNVAGVTRQNYSLTVLATCKLDLIKNMDMKSITFIYFEYQQVHIKCLKGFKLLGESNLTCGINGFFNHGFPTCEDIDECKNISFIDDVGSGGMRDENRILTDDNENNTEEESDVCGMNAKCVNKPGSYKCICNKDYQMRDGQCVWAPGGGNIIPTLPSHRPKPQDYTWLDMLIQHFKEEVIDENQYLEIVSEQLVQKIPKLEYDSWKEDALKNLLKVLDVSVEKADDIVIQDINRNEIYNRIKNFVIIVNQALSTDLQQHWVKVNEGNKSGSASLMKSVENYLQNQIKQLSLQDLLVINRNISLSNIEIRIQPVLSSKSVADLKMNMEIGGNGTSIRVPSENYDMIKDSVGIAILYKTLNKMLPKGHSEEHGEMVAKSNVFSFSFTTRKKVRFRKPIVITFNFNALQPVPSCSYWNFQDTFSGSWSSDGCNTTINETNYAVACECNHLTNFAVLIPKVIPKSTGPKVMYLTFTLTLAVGAGLCILLAFITCMSHICCSSYVRSDRQTILCNLTMIIVMGMLVFLGAVFLSFLKLIPENLSSHFCFSMVGIVQLFGVAFFGWIFVESVHLFFSTRTVIDRKHGHLTWFYLIGWGIPVTILAATGILVYLNKFNLQTRCLLHISFYLIAVLVGAPSALFVLATVVVYLIVTISMKKNKELLSPEIVSHTKRALLCSSGLMLIHLIVLTAISFYLHFNPHSLYSNILGGVAILEGLYLVIYHCYLDRKKTKPNSRQNSKRRNSYSTKDTISYSANDSPDPNSSDPNENKYLIKRSSKRSSSDTPKGSPSQVHTRINNHDVVDETTYISVMYGVPQDSPGSPEQKPLLTRQDKIEGSSTIQEDDFDDGLTTLPTFNSQVTLTKTSSLPRSRNNSLPRNYQKRHMRQFDEYSTDGKVLKRSNSKTSSIVSVETHNSDATDKGTLPVYFPSAPPHYEMTLDRKKKEAHTIDSYLDSNPTSRCTSFGIDSDRMSNISSELSNILFELQAFDTDRHPSETHNLTFRSNENSKTLPAHSKRREPVNTDISRNVSTFKPARRFAKTEVKYENKPQNSGDNHRVRILRGKNSRGETDPSDGLHGNTDSMYSSL